MFAAQVSGFPRTFLSLQTYPSFEFYQALAVMLEHLFSILRVNLSRISFIVDKPPGNSMFRRTVFFGVVGIESFP